ncbi:MAG TPA: branched-chain amino acid ABC transporter permease [Candidatus Dormibacteraeota bacterium]|nr:branched-chain amino acid ABC transporter permease [Candidatus Dormibacteraeota bacterium]
MHNLSLPLVDGLGQGVLLFLIASGLTLVYGVMRVLNFSHGGFFMLGAYFTYSLARGQALPAPALVAIVVAAGLLTALVGALTERGLFRRLYPLPEISSLLGTFALLLVFEGLGRLVWGIAPLSQPQSPAFLGRLHLGSVSIPAYDVFLYAVGAAVVFGLEWLVEKTEFGRMVRATAADRQMAALLGIDVERVFLAMFSLGIFLAGLGGGLVSPLVGLTPDLAVSFIIQAFAIVIVGGLGSIRGTLIAALFFGLLNAYLVALRPGLADFSLYIGMGVFLLLRPQGIMGRAGPAGELNA